MNKWLAIFLFFAFIAKGNAAVWVKLQDKADAKLMIDKQSLITTDKLKRAWVKIIYKTPQTNPEIADKTYNLSKLLWFFDCTQQKAATSQVNQYSDDEVIFSAAIDAKSAKFIEPVPETELDVAMRYVCEIGVTADASSDKTAATKPTSAEAAKKTSPTEDKAKVEKNSSKPKAVEPSKAAMKVLEQLAKPVGETKSALKTPEKSIKETEKQAPLKQEQDKAIKTESKPASDDKDKKVHWSYEGKEGPDNWGKLSPEFATCEVGRNQSPVNIDSTIKATLKPLKKFQRFPANDIVNNGHTIQANFKPGNIVVVDSVLYTLKQMHFHAPSENTIHGKSFPLEAHFVHADPSGNLTVIAVMFQEGQPNAALSRLLEQAPKQVDAPAPLKGRILSSDLLPIDSTYYRFSGSLTTPPCTEGVNWLVMKTPMSASKQQLDAFKSVLQHENSRPVQPLNARFVIE